MDFRKLSARLFILISLGVMKTMLAGEFVIDDRSSGNLKSNLGIEWRLVSDQVMGGVSNGNSTHHLIADQSPLNTQIGFQIATTTIIDYKLTS